MESRTPVTPVRVDWPCGADGCMGMMHFAGEAFTNATGTVYQHKCSECRRRADARTSYPYIDYEDARQLIFTGDPSSVKISEYTEDSDPGEVQ